MYVCIRIHNTNDLNKAHAVAMSPAMIRLSTVVNCSGCVIIKQIYNIT